jgi:hypothetical protein
MILSPSKFKNLLVSDPLEAISYFRTWSEKFDTVRAEKVLSIQKRFSENEKQFSQGVISFEEYFENRTDLLKQFIEISLVYEAEFNAHSAATSFIPPVAKWSIEGKSLEEIFEYFSKTFSAREYIQNWLPVKQELELKTLTGETISEESSIEIRQKLTNWFQKWNQEKEEFEKAMFDSIISRIESLTKSTLEFPDEEKMANLLEVCILFFVEFPRFGGISRIYEIQRSFNSGVNVLIKKHNLEIYNQKITDYVVEIVSIFNKIKEKR